MKLAIKNRKHKKSNPGGDDDDASDDDDAARARYEARAVAALPAWRRPRPGVVDPRACPLCAARRPPLGTGSKPHQHLRNLYRAAHRARTSPGHQKTKGRASHTTGAWGRHRVGAVRLRHVPSHGSAPASWQSEVGSRASTRSAGWTRLTCARAVTVRWTIWVGSRPCEKLSASSYASIGRSAGRGEARLPGDASASPMTGARGRRRGARGRRERRQPRGRCARGRRGRGARRRLRARRRERRHDDAPRPRRVPLEAISKERYRPLVGDLGQWGS